MDALEYFIQTDVGVARDHNEDAVIRVVVPVGDGEEAHVLVVADGMGGENAGEVASQALVQRFESALADLVDESGVGPAMQEVVRQVNEELVEMSRENPEQYGGMGTTVVAAAFHSDGRVEIVHVGDSRLYAFDDDGIRRVTRDHSRVQLYVDAGVMSEEQADRHPDSNVLLRAVGRAGTEADLHEDESLTWVGKTFLLCSDGLTAMVPDEVIELAMASLEPEDATRALIQECIRLGATDNVSIAVVRSGEPVSPLTEDEFREQSRELVRAWKERAEEEARRKRMAADEAFEASSARAATPSPLASESAESEDETQGYRLMRKAIPILIVLILLFGVALAVLLRSKPNPTGDDVRTHTEEDEPSPENETTPEPTGALGADPMGQDGGEGPAGTDVDPGTRTDTPQEPGFDSGVVGRGDIPNLDESSPENETTPPVAVQRVDKPDTEPAGGTDLAEDNGAGDNGASGGVSSGAPAPADEATSAPRGDVSAGTAGEAVGDDKPNTATPEPSPQDASGPPKRDAAE